MPEVTIRQILQELEDDIQPYSIKIKPRVDSTPILEIVFERVGSATYTIDFEHSRDVSDERDFLTPGLVNTSPVLLVEFDKGRRGAIDAERYIGFNLIYNTFEREREHGDPETVAEYYSCGTEYINDTQQTAWHLTHRADQDAPYVHAFV